MEGIFNQLKNPQVFVTAIGALLGAFSAFVLVISRDWIGKVYDRKRKHYDALVRLEAHFQDQGGVIHDNVYLLPHFMAALNRGALYWSNLSEIEYDKRIIYDLHNLELINDLYSYHYDLRRANDDIRAIQGGYKNIEQAFMAHNIDDDTYLLNAKGIATNLEVLRIYLEDDLQKSLVRIIAKVRILIRKDRTLGMKVKQFLVGKSIISKTEIQAEIKALEKEIDATRKRSKVEKDKIFGKE
jgi:hypothetical protein